MELVKTNAIFHASTHLTCAATIYIDLHFALLAETWKVRNIFSRELIYINAMYMMYIHVYDAVEICITLLCNAFLSIHVNAISFFQNGIDKRICKIYFCEIYHTNDVIVYYHAPIFLVANLSCRPKFFNYFVVCLDIWVVTIHLHLFHFRHFWNVFVENGMGRTLG